MRKSSATCADGGKLVAVGVGSKRPVRHALDEKADSVRRLRAWELGAQKFSVRNDPRGQFRRRVRSDCQDPSELQCSQYVLGRSSLESGNYLLYRW